MRLHARRHMRRSADAKPPASGSPGDPGRGCADAQAGCLLRWGQRACGPPTSPPFRLGGQSMSPSARDGARGRDRPAGSQRDSRKRQIGQLSFCV